MKFELGFAFRGTNAPEVRQVVEASSMREAMLNIMHEHGGDDVVLVTHAHYFQRPEPLPTCPELASRSSAASFMLSAS